MLKYAETVTVGFRILLNLVENILMEQFFQCSGSPSIPTWFHCMSGQDIIDDDDDNVDYEDDDNVYDDDKNDDYDLD